MYRFALALCAGLGLWALEGLQAQAPAFIHVDQFGYAPDAEKVAVCSDPQSGFNAADSYTPADHLVLLEVSDCAADPSACTRIGRFAVEAWDSGNTHAASGDRGWWVDFSTLGTPGMYRLVDTVHGRQSPDFAVRENPYVEVLEAAGRMLYYNRCGTDKPAAFAGTAYADGPNFLGPLQDPACRFIDDPTNAALERDLRGGWFDAGDYNKYVSFAVSAVHNLLEAHREHPEAFLDNWGIPESGNGVPDLLDEVRWELDWVLRMVASDGTVPIKVGSRNHTENSGFPPSANSDPRYYGPNCTSSSISAWCILAHAALHFGTQPGLGSYADSLEAAAIRCWNYLQPILALGPSALEVDCDDGSIVAGDADLTADEQSSYAVAAAWYHYRLTGDADALAFFQSTAASTEPLASGFWSAYNPVLVDALLAFAEHMGPGDALAGSIRASAAAAVDNNYNGYFGFSPPADLYRGFMPDWSYHWGSNQVRAGYGILNLQMAQASVLPGMNGSLRRYAAEALHHFHGVNPLGLVYLSSMDTLGASHSCRQIYHAWFADASPWDGAGSAYGPPPGYVVGGPNPSFSVGSLSPPAGQPLQKAYLDFNDGWPLNSWEITEPAIYYQAAYIRLLASAVTGEDPTPSTVNSNPGMVPLLDLRPNPTTRWVQVNCPVEQGRLLLYDAMGQKLGVQSFDQYRPSLDLGGLPAGSYWILAVSSQGQALGKAKVLLVP